MNGDIAMTNALTTASGRPAAEVLRMTPGRRVLLAIGVPVALALIGWTGFGFVADIGQASFPVSDNIAVHDGQLAVSVNSGDLTVSGSSGTTARLTGKVQYDLIRPDFTESNTATGTRLGVACRIPVGNCGLAATLEVPPRTAVSLSSGGGDLAVSGIDTDLTLNSYGGDMSVNGGSGRDTLYTGGGDLTADNLSGVLTFYSAGGDIGSSGLSSSAVTAYSGGGDVALVFTQVPRNLSITSAGGDISVVLPPGDASYDLVTNTGGGDISEPGIKINNSSSNQITLDSGGGDISVTEAS
jgi:hypothetical protein